MKAGPFLDSGLAFNFNRRDTDSRVDTPHEPKEQQEQKVRHRQKAIASRASKATGEPRSNRQRPR